MKTKNGKTNGKKNSICRVSDSVSLDLDEKMGNNVHESSLKKFSVNLTECNV